MAIERVLVVGGTGFIGRALQERAMDMGVGDTLVFSFPERPEGIQELFKKVQADLSLRDGGSVLKEYQLAIFMGGQGGKKAAGADPAKDVQMNVVKFLNLMRYFRGSLVLLSSQSVYQGLEGSIDEKVVHVPQSPYGISNRMLEAYADYFFHLGWLRKLWVFRLLYAYGKGEPERRLLPMCTWAATNNGKVSLHGGGKSFLNPLPAGFIGDVLLSAGETVRDLDDGSKETFNVNHPRRMTVLDAVKVLSAAKFFEYSVDEGAERWPVKYYGNTSRLEGLLKSWKISFPDERKSLVDYFIETEMKPVKPIQKPTEKKAKKEVIWPV